MFHVSVQGDRVLSDFDVVGRAGSRNRGVVVEVEVEPDAEGNLEVVFERAEGSRHPTLLCGLEIRAIERSARR